MKKLFIFLSFVLIMPSCDNYEKLTAYIQPAKEIEFDKNEFQLIQDISFLFLIDDSVSMDKSIKTLSENITLFLKPVFLNYPHYNYNFAITTLSELEFIDQDQKGQPIFVDNDRKTKCNNVIPSEFSRTTNIGPYLHYSKENLKEINHEDLICVISHNLTHLKGSQTEPFFDSLSYIINESNQEFEKDFFGQHKFLVLFFLSDQWGQHDKGYGDTDSDFDVQKMKSIADHFSEEKLKLLQSVVKRENIRTYAVVFNAENHYKKNLDCTADDSTGDTLKQYPYHLYSLIEKTGGLKASLCDSHWGGKLVNIFDDLKTSVFQQYLYLDDIPQLDTIEVFLNNKKVPRDVNKGWSFNPESFSINIGSELNYHIYIDTDEPKNNKFKVKYHPVNIRLLGKE